MNANEVTGWVVQPEALALRPVANAPRLTATIFDPLAEIEVVDEQGAHRSIHIPVERPLTVIVDDIELVTLMTLGAQPELLVLGYLRNQRLIEDLTAIESITVDAQSGTALVKTLGGRAPGGTGTGGRLVSTGCALGTQFGELMLRIAELATREPSTPELSIPTLCIPKLSRTRMSQRTLMRLLEVAREHDAIHDAAGSVHSCALFAGAKLFVAVEDVSRHNGVDTITGWMALHGVAGDDKTLFTTGRLTGEMVMKAAHNGISMLVSRNGVTSMGFDLARKLGMMLFTRASNRRFILSAGAERFDAEPAGS